MDWVPQHYDVAVIGAGIAGASVAAELAGSCRVVLLEQENQAGYHTTGRSAAVYAPLYGPQPIRALTRASLVCFERPAEGFTDSPLLSKIDAFFVARPDQERALDTMQKELIDVTTVQRVGASELRARMPLLREGYAIGGIWDSGTYVIDVAAVHHAYLRRFKNEGGNLILRSGVIGLARTNSGWGIKTTLGDITADIVINAAGAWAEQIGQMANAEHIGLVPKRRTALIVDAPKDIDVADLPFVVDVDEQFYLKPDAGKFLISPANEDPEVPCDVRPDEMDIAICIDRIERAFNISVRRIEASWAGLRSFVADKCPVAGFSYQAEGFYWLAGQGGYGIQSAPALAQLAAAEVLRRPIPEQLVKEGLDPAKIRPARQGIGHDIN